MSSECSILGDKKIRCNTNLGEVGRQMIDAYMFSFYIKVISTITGLDRPGGSQEVRFSRLHDNGTGCC